MQQQLLHASRLYVIYASRGKTESHVTSNLACAYAVAALNVVHLRQPREPVSLLLSTVTAKLHRLIALVTAGVNATSRCYSTWGTYSSGAGAHVERRIDSLLRVTGVRTEYPTGPWAEPLVVGQGGQAPLKLKAFQHLGFR